MRCGAAGRLLQRELATAVEVWQGTECIGRLRAGRLWTEVHSQWIDPVTPSFNQKTTP